MINLDSLDDLEFDQEVIDPNEAAREEWMQKRHGKITTSKFEALVGKGQKGAAFTKTGYAYLNLVIAERLGSWHSFKAGSTEWGKEHEAKALQAYQDRYGIEAECQPYQFFKLEDGIGGTPDATVGMVGCVEAKCPWNPAIHVNTLITREIPKEYIWQVEGHMLVTGRQWCDFISFDPRMSDPERLVAIRHNRNEEVMTFLLRRLREGRDYVNQTVSSIRDG